MNGNYPENDWRNYLEHSTGEWKVHKYIQKIGDRYIYPATRRVATAVAGLSKKNRERKAYRETGMNARERKLAKARADINSRYQNEYGPSAGYSRKNRAATVANRLRGTVESVKKRARKGVNTLRSKQILGTTRARKRVSALYNRAMDALRNTKAYRTLDPLRQRAANRLHSAGTNARTAVGNTKSKLRTTARNAKTKYSTKNINRRIYRNTGVDVEETARRAKHKAKGLKRKAYRKTGLKALKD